MGRMEGRASSSDRRWRIRPIEGQADIATARAAFSTNESELVLPVTIETVLVGEHIDVDRHGTPSA